MAEATISDPEKKDTTPSGDKETITSESPKGVPTPSGRILAG